jgi:hypothetical protein
MELPGKCAQLRIISLQLMKHFNLTANSRHAKGTYFEDLQEQFEDNKEVIRSDFL